jgi:hypothetical protein
MQKRILTLLGAALIAASAAQVALAAQPHRSHIADRARVKTQERWSNSQWRNSNAYVPPARQADAPVAAPFINFDATEIAPAGH